jgi:hypothetical protein
LWDGVGDLRLRSAVGIERGRSEPHRVLELITVPGTEYDVQLSPGNKLGDEQRDPKGIGEAPNMISFQFSGGWYYYSTLEDAM